MISIKPFEWHYQQGLAALWREALPLDPISDQRLCTQIFLDRNFDPEGLLLAFDGSHLVGAVCAVIQRDVPHALTARDTAGWIRFFFVAPSSRGRGLGTRLLSAAIGWLGSKSVQRIRFSDNLPTYITPGLNSERYPVASAMLRDRGFGIVGCAQSMARSVDGYQPSAALVGLRDDLQAQGFQIRPPTRPDLLSLVELARNGFSEDWADLIRNVAYHHNPAERIVIAVDPEDAVIGWAMYGSYPETLSRFGPFGVSPLYRGKGVGAVLLDCTLAMMWGAGLTRAWFLWVEPNSPAEHLYLRAGFEIQERYDILQLETGLAPT